MATDAAFDAALFRRLLSLGLHDAARPITQSLGLSGFDVRQIAMRYMPEQVPALEDDTGPVAAPDDEALEESDLRAFLLEHRAGASDVESWLAAIIARRSLGANHLWQDLGLVNRDELNRLFQRHFPGLLIMNADNMKWKKFFYRQLCQREGIPICKSPNCDDCPDSADCFGPETGGALVGSSTPA